MDMVTFYQFMTQVLIIGGILGAVWFIRTNKQ